MLNPDLTVECHFFIEGNESTVGFMDYKVQSNVKRQHDDDNDPSRGEVDKESSSVGDEQAPFFYQSG